MYVVPFNNSPYLVKTNKEEITVISIRKIISFALVLSFGLGFFSSSALAKPITIKCAGISPVEQVSTKQMLAMAAEIEKLTNGEVKVKCFPASQLGDYGLIYEEITKGTIDMGVIPIPTTYEKAHQIVYVPYLARDYNDAKKMFSSGSWLADTCNKLHSKLGVKFLGFQIHGLGGIGTNTPINKPLDPNVDKGVLIRVPPMDMENLLVKTLSYNTVTIPYSDLYTSFQAGLCQGWYGGSASYSYEGFRDVLKHYYAFNLFVDAESIIISDKTWKKLSPSQQEAVKKAASNMSAKSIAEAEKTDGDYMNKLEKAGLKVYRYTPAELEANVKKVRAEVWPQLGKFIGEDLAKRLIKEYASK